PCTRWTSTTGTSCARKARSLCSASSGPRWPATRATTRRAGIQASKPASNGLAIARCLAMATKKGWPPDGQVEIGYTLSSEEQQPEELVHLARAAEDSGFPFAVISDHYHPWTDRQGSSPFVWSVLGAIAARTERLRVGTGVTCPTIRYHPAILAQASATVARLMPGRFFLGLGSGER